MFSFWPVVGAVGSLLFLIVRWWLKRSAKQEGREEVQFENMEGRSDAQDKAHMVASWWRVNPPALKRMHEEYKRKRKDSV